MVAITKGVKRGACWMTSQTCKVIVRRSDWRLTGKLAGKPRMLEAGILEVAKDGGAAI